MVLSLQRLTEFYGLEIERGQAGLGNFNLRAGLLPVSLLSGAAGRDTPAPESIVHTIRCGAVSTNVEGDTAVRTPPSVSTASGHSAPLSASSAQSTDASSSSSTAMSLSSDTTQCVTDEPHEDTTRLNVQERAARVIDNGNISLDSRLTCSLLPEPRSHV